MFKIYAVILSLSKYLLQSREPFCKAKPSTTDNRQPSTFQNLKYNESTLTQKKKKPATPHICEAGTSDCLAFLLQ